LQAHLGNSDNVPFSFGAEDDLAEQQAGLGIEADAHFPDLGGLAGALRESAFDGGQIERIGEEHRRQEDDDRQQ